MPISKRKISCASCNFGSRINFHGTKVRALKTGLITQLWERFTSITAFALTTVRSGYEHRIYRHRWYHRKCNRVEVKYGKGGTPNLPTPLIPPKKGMSSAVSEVSVNSVFNNSHTIIPGVSSYLWFVKYICKWSVGMCTFGLMPNSMANTAWL